ncbi:MAG: hypothetical protein Fues2KO_36890 [Fuerstiella sp.]
MTASFKFAAKSPVQLATTGSRRTAEIAHCRQNAAAAFTIELAPLIEKVRSRTGTDNAVLFRICPGSVSVKFLNRF